MARNRLTSRQTVILSVVLLAAGLVGCGGLFGLSGYEFEDSILDGGPDGPTSDAPIAPDGAHDDAANDGGPAAPTCTDRIANGTETDIDCGGMCPAKCAAKKGCLLGKDCDTKLACVERVCLSPSANDGVLDGDETDVDCGGPSAPSCDTGKSCVKADRDCKSLVCTGGVCQAPSPTDGLKNGTETDIDCGGGAPNPTCADTKKCIDGFRDCSSRVCTNLQCKAATATDGYKNGAETDVDCGGGSAPACIVGKVCAQGPRDCVSQICTGGACIASAPSDGVKNGAETDIDCGGGAAPACGNGKTCVQSLRDCTSKICAGGTCQTPTSSDMVKNGAETDVDCGGGAAPACADGKECTIGSRDCTSLVCGGAGSCLAPTAMDGVKNGSETDLDCGGGGANPGCAIGKLCLLGLRDCTSTSKVCTDGTCRAPTNTDGVSNGTETDIDCGGGNGAPACGNGKLCVQGPRDCTSFVCGGTCLAPTAADGVKNGTETDIDCGGGAPAPACADGKACVLPTDCTSANCMDLVCAP